MRSLAGLPDLPVEKPQTVADRIAEILREAISNGGLEAGAVLRQDELAARFGFSRMPIRDALRRLEAEGLVSIHPTRGASVAKMDAVEISEIYAVREILETHALALAIPNLTEVALAEAADILDIIDAEPDIGRWGLLNQAFHLTLYQGCGNARLISLIEAQHKAADRYVRILLSHLDYRDRSQREHREILRACREHNETSCRTWIIRHLKDGSRTLVDAIV